MGMKKLTIVLVLIIIVLFLVAFPGISTLMTTSQLREDLATYCKNTSPLVNRELEMYDLYYQGEFDSIRKKAQVVSYDLLKCKPKRQEVDLLYKRYLEIWDDWSNQNVADLFGYGYSDNELIKYHEDVIKLADGLGLSDRELGSYSRAKWREDKKIIIKMSKKYLLGTD